MASFIRTRQEHDEDPPLRSASSAVEYDEMDAVIHNDDDAAAEFIERLGDLDQFVAAAPDAVRFAPAAATARNHRTSTDSYAPVRSGFNAAGEFIVLDGADDFPAQFAVAAPAPTEPVQDEAAEFLERLGDLDRFITAAPSQDASDDADEAAEFLQRLGDLDQFVGAGDANSAQATLCPACLGPVAANDVSAVHAVHLLGAIEGRQIEGAPRQFHPGCWVDGDGSYRRTT